jgi:hypothetical protein
MSINMSVAIKGSVGSRGTNNSIDVRVVQQRLNDLMPGQRNKLIANGQVGLATIGAIYEFQKVVCGFNTPDSRVDPDKTTMRFLNDPGSKQKWGGHSLATTSANVDVELLRFSSWLQSLPKQTQSEGNTQKLAQLKAELKNLETAIQQKFPDGRPSGLGVLAIYTPGDVTIGGLKKMADTINSVQRAHGAAAGCAAALVSTIAVPFIIYWGGAADLFVTIGELAMGNPKHGNPAEYDRAMREISAIRQKLQSAGN